VHTKIEKQLEFSTGKDFLTVNGHVILIWKIEYKVQECQS
jgi:hypothetical protein